MAIASWMIRGRSLRSGRYNRSNDDENVQLDLSKDPKDNIQEIFRHICQRHGVVEGKKLGYLNAFVKLVSQPCIEHNQLGYSKEELLCCLRVALVHEATQVRAAGLRAVRYLIQDENDVRSLVKLQIPFLIARSIDLALRNDLERIQAMRIIRRILALSPSNFPVALVRCLVSLANGAGEANDRMLRASLAILCEICVLNPLLFMKCGGITPLVRNILDCGLPRISESLVGCLLYLLDKPETRAVARLDLQCFAEPFCDYYFRKGSSSSANKAKEAKEIRERELRLYSSHISLLSVLRSWPGLLHFCSPSGNSGLQALVDILYLKQLEIRKAVLDLLYDLLSIPLPDWTDELSVALDAVDPSHPQDTWRLSEGFVAAEGKSVLPHLSKYRPNIIVNHLSALLQAFLDAGLLAAIVEVIVSEDTFLSVRATILLGQLLHMMHLLLPSECCNVTPPLPSLMWYAVSSSPLDQSTSPSSLPAHAEQTFLKILASMQPALKVTKATQQQAQASVAAMNQLHRLLKRRPAPASLYLAQILNSSSRYHSEARKVVREDNQTQGPAVSTPKSDPERSSNLRRRRSFSERVLGIATRGRYSKSKLQQMLAKESEDALKESGVLTTKDGFSWNWDIVRSILQSKSESLLKLEDSNHRTFVKRLVHFYKPSSNRFSRVEVGGNRKQTNTYTLAGIEVLDVLLHADEVEGTRLCKELLDDIYSQVEDILLAKSAHDCLFSPQHITNSLCQDYFLFVGHLCQSRKGSIFLESTGLLALFHRLAVNTNHDCYIKLVISSLDYAVPALPREILETVLKSGSESSRLYATQFMVVLLRARVPNFHDWGLSLVLNQLKDSSKSVQLCALSILDEACDEPIFLQSLAAQQPILNANDERELLIMIRLASVPAGFSYLHQTGFLTAQLRFWAEEFNYRYVRFIEGEIHDALSLHQRGEDGHYSRRVSSAKHVVKDVFIPPHLYGQLVQHSDGCKLLHQDTRVLALMKIVKDQHCTSDQDILELKAAVWAVSHLAVSAAGLEWIASEGVIHSLIMIAQNCPVYSLRATAFYSIGLVATTAAGADALAELGWMSVRHHRHERWPVIHHNLETTDSRLILAKENYSPQLQMKDETETESSGVTEEDSCSLWDDSLSNNGVQFWNETSPITDVPSRKACTLPHQRVIPEWPRKQQRSLSESQSGSPQLQPKMNSLGSSCLTSSSLDTTGTEAPVAALSKGLDLKKSTDTAIAANEAKSQLLSCSDNGVCSTEPSGVKHTGDRIHTLSPIPSSTSLNTLKSAKVNDAVTPLVPAASSRHQEELLHSSSLQGSTASDHMSPTHNALSSHSSQQDVTGYATLRLLQRQQRPQLPNLSSNLHFSFGGADNFLDDINLVSSSFSRGRQTPSILSSMRRLKVRSLDRQSSHPVFLNFDSKVSHEILSAAPIAFSSPSELDPTNTTKDFQQCYLGISLPLKSSLLYPSATLLQDSGKSSNADHNTNEMQSDRGKRSTSLSYNEMERVQETGEEPDLPQSLQPSSESEDELESEEGGGNRIERERGRGSRRSARSALSNIVVQSHSRRRRGRSYTQAASPYHHQTASCLACSLRQSTQPASTLRERKISSGSYHHRTRTETESSCGTTEANDSPSHQRTMSVGAFGGSMESTTSTETVGSAQDSSTAAPRKSRAAVRSEVMIHVECMSNPILVKPCQQALLQSKQKYPQMLDDVCLYSDICENLSSCNYRLQSRRFLQEVFLDVSFCEIYDDAINIVKIVPSMNSSDENNQARSISVSLPPGEGLLCSGAVKIVENPTQIPLSMVLEELSGSEERRGSCSSSAPGSIPRFVEIRRDPQTVSDPFKNFSQKPGMFESDHSKKDKIAVLTSDKHESISSPARTEVSERQELLSSPTSIQTLDLKKINSEEEDKIDVLVEKSSIDCVNKQTSVVTKPVRKTVYSLLSQNDAALRTRRKSEGEHIGVQKTCSKEEDSAIKCDDASDPREPCSPVRLFNCRLQSGDGSDIRSLKSESSSDQECASQLSPSRMRKVATICQPNIAVLHSRKQSSD